MRPLRHPSSTRAGFTLIELAIVTLVFAVLMGAFALVSVTSHKTYRESSRAAVLDQRLRRALDSISSELRVVAGSLMAPDPQNALGTDRIDFRQALGIVNGKVTWGPQSRIAFEFAPGEINDGVDNDGNGMVDDGWVVLTRDVGGAAQRFVLCRGVREAVPGEPINGLDDNGNGVTDEGGFNLQRVGDVMIIRLSIEGPGLDGATFVRTGQTSIRLRNIKA
jgi:prepilin-type N-terminal cleavage/methylation domain-containing protein